MNSVSIIETFFTFWMQYLDNNFWRCVLIVVLGGPAFYFAVMKYITFFWNRKWCKNQSRVFSRSCLCMFCVVFVFLTASQMADDMLAENWSVGGDKMGSKEVEEVVREVGKLTHTSVCMDDSGALFPHLPELPYTDENMRKLASSASLRYLSRWTAYRPKTQVLETGLERVELEGELKTQLSEVFVHGKKEKLTEMQKKLVALQRTVLNGAYGNALKTISEQGMTFFWSFLAVGLLFLSCLGYKDIRKVEIAISLQRYTEKK